MADPMVVTLFRHGMTLLNKVVLYSSGRPNLKRKFGIGIMG